MNLDNFAITTIKSQKIHFCYQACLVSCTCWFPCINQASQRSNFTHLHTTKVIRSSLAGGRTNNFIIICEKFNNFVVIVNLAQVIYFFDLTQFYLGFNWHGFGQDWGSVHLTLLGLQQIEVYEMQVNKCFQSQMLMLTLNI